MPRSSGEIPQFSRQNAPVETLRPTTTGGRVEVVDGESACDSPYDLFAAVYNRHFGHFARRLVPVLDHLLLGKLREGARVLDVCCGTGQLAKALAERGFAVTGIDRSREMLRFARENAPTADFLLGDVCRWNPAEAFSAAVSTFDSINHILTLEDLASAFRNVHRALQPGGLFVFDMNMDQGFRCRWWGTWQGVEDGHQYFVRAHYSPQTKLGHNVVTRRRSASEPKTEFRFTERCYSEAEVRNALTRVGFVGTQVYDGHENLDLLGEIGRSFFACQKPGASRVDLPVENPSLRGCPSANTVHSREEGVRAGRRPRLRTLSTCEADGLWLRQSQERELGPESRRLKAVEEVLCTLPPGPYRLLQGRAARFAWFIPAPLVLGQVHAFPAAGQPGKDATGGEPHLPVVYLSPILEQHESPVVVAVVVHELAHVMLAHRLLGLDAASYERQEAEVRQAVRDWGYQVEAGRAEALLLESIVDAQGGNDRAGCGETLGPICRNTLRPANHPPTAELARLAGQPDRPRD